VLGGVGEVRLRVASAQPGERPTFGEFPLAAVLGELERSQLLAEGLVEAAGADRGELTWIANQDRLSVCLFDEPQERREDARLSHPCLVNDQDAAVRQAVRAGRVDEQPMERAARDAGRGRHLKTGKIRCQRRQLEIVSHARGSVVRSRVRPSSSRAKTKEPSSSLVRPGRSPGSSRAICVPPAFQ
jgi:hypothetical protein